MNTICVTAKPRALTQSGSATCAATIRLDITASQAAPMTSMIGIASARVCTTASAAIAAAVTRPPPSTSRSGEMRPRIAGSSSAPATAPAPIEPNSTP